MAQVEVTPTAGAARREGRVHHGRRGRRSAPPRRGGSRRRARGVVLSDIEPLDASAASRRVRPCAPTSPTPRRCAAAVAHRGRALRRPRRRVRQRGHLRRRSRRSPSTPRTSSTHVLAVNVRGPFHVAKHALAAMRDGGSLILNSSVVGLTSDAGDRRLRDLQARAARPHAHGGEGGRGARDPREHDPSGPGRQRVPAPHRDRRHRPRRRRRPRRSSRAMIPLGRHATAEEIAAAVAVPGERREPVHHRRRDPGRRRYERVSGVSPDPSIPAASRHRGRSPEPLDRDPE